MTAEVLAALREVADGAGIAYAEDPSLATFQVVVAEASDAATLANERNRCARTYRARMSDASATQDAVIAKSNATSKTGGTAPRSATARRSAR